MKGLFAQFPWLACGRTLTSGFGERVPLSRGLNSQRVDIANERGTL